MNDPKTLKKLRSDKKLSQRQLAALLGVSQQAVAGWETGSRQPRLPLILSLSKIFDKDAGEIIEAITAQN